MARIRDLGINVIPATMRPLEIGPGAAIMDPVGGPLPMLYACQACACDEGSSENESSCCDPSGCPDPIPSLPVDDDQEEKKEYHASGFTNDAVTQLKQQLKSHLAQALQ